MTSSDFQLKCKNALVDILKEKYNQEYSTEDFHLVWFTKALGNFKCCMCDLKPNMRYYELTYNGNKNELYVDIYSKEHNICVSNI